MNFFTMRAERIWNSLPNRVKEHKSVNAFKTAYDRWCLGVETEKNSNRQRPEEDVAEANDTTGNE